MKVLPGRPYPLGATFDGAGVNFALFSEFATKVELCLFDSEEATKETAKVVFREQTDMIWHAYLPAVGPRPAVRLPRAWAVRTQEGPPLQSQQGFARPLRKGDRPGFEVGRFAFLATRSEPTI